MNRTTIRRSAMRSIGRGTLTLALVAALAGCKDDPVKPGEPIGADDLERLSPGIHAVLSVPQLEEWTPERSYHVRLHLKAVDVGAGVSSYQGELLYDDRVVQIVEATFPDGLMGVWNETKPGVVRFAGISLEAVGARPAIDLVVTTTRRLQARDFSVSLEEVVGVESFENLTSRVAKQDRPLLTKDVLDEAVTVSEQRR